MDAQAGHRSESEVIFLVEEAPEGGFTARALGASIFTEADDVAGLHANVREAVTRSRGSSASTSCARKSSRGEPSARRIR